MRLDRILARAAVVVVLAALCLVFPAGPGGPLVARAAQSSCAPPVALVNGDFEAPAIAANAMNLIAQANFPGWKTTAPDKVFELWHEVRQGFSAGTGVQFVELNANYVSTLYQDLPTTPGQTLRWELKHLGRLGTDVMAVEIGPPSGTLVQQGSTLSDGNTAWGTHFGRYTVPAGQTLTRFAFESISAAQNKPTYGNFLDGISFGTSACLATTTAVQNSSGNATANVGDVLTYTTTTRNDGGNPAQLGVLADDLPAGVTFVPGSIRSISAGGSSTVSDGADGDTGEYDSAGRTVRVRAGLGAGSSAGGTIAVGDSRSFSYQARVTSAAAGTTISDDATATFTDPVAAAQQTSTSNLVTTPVAAAADLGVSATIAAPGVVAGQNATTTVSVLNRGPNPASTVQVTAVVPPGITSVTASSGSGPCTVNGSTAVCDIPSLAASATATMTVTGSVPAPATPGAQATLTASVTSATYELNQADNATSVSAAVATLADVGVVMTYAPAVPVAGATVTYTATVTNDGPSVARGIMLTDPVATGSTFVSAATSGGSCSITSSTRTVECTVPDLNPGAGTTVSIVVQLNPGGTGAVNNAVSVTAATPDPDVTDNNFSVQSAGTAQADMGVQLSIGATSAYPGDVVPYTLKVTNNGPSVATNVSFNTVVPPGFTIVRPTDPNDPATTFCTATACTFPGLPPNQTVTISGTAQVGLTAPAGVQKASTTVISPTTDTNPANDTDTVTFTILLRADLSVTQTITNPGDPGGLVAGQSVRGVVTVTNNGPTRSEGVVLRQAVPAGQTIPVAGTTGGGSCAFQGTGSPGGTTPDGGTYVCGTSLLGPAATWQITFGAVPLAANYPAAAFARTATASATSPDPDASNDTVTTTVAVEHRADLEVTMSTSTPSVVQTEAVRLHVAVRNLGPSDASGVVVRPDPPSGLTLGAGTPSDGSYDARALTWTLPQLAVATTAGLDLTGTAQDAGPLTTPARIVAATSTDPASANDSDSATVQAAAAAPALALDATATVSSGQPSAAAGDTITFGYRVTNTGNLTMTQLVVTGSRGGAGTCAAATLAPGAATTCTAGSYPVTSADITAGTPIADAVTATAENSAAAGPTQYAQTTATVPLVAAHPSLVAVVTPTVGAAARQHAAAAGDRIDYQYTVINNGNVAMDAIAVTDLIAGGITCTATTLPIGAWTSCGSAPSAGYSVTQADLDAGVAVTDAATVTATPSGSSVAQTFGPFGADVTVAAPVPVLDLVVTAVATAPVGAGDGIAYDYRVTNSGNVTVAALTVSDVNATTVTCGAASVAVGASVVCHSIGPYLVTQADVDAGVPVQDDAVASGQGVAPGSAAATAEDSDAVAVVAAAPALGLTLTPAVTPAGHSGGVLPGDRIAAGYLVRNTGNVTMTGVQVTDSLAGAATCPGTAVAVGATMTCAAAGPRVVALLDIEAATPIALSAQVLGRPPGQATATQYGSATATVPVSPGTAVLTIAMRALVTPADHQAAVDVGDTIDYEYTVANVGLLTMVGLAVVDEVSGAAECPDSALSPGESTTCTSARPYTVTSQDVGAAGSIVGRASVTGRSPGASPVTFGPATAAVSVIVSAPALRARTTAAVSPAAHQGAAAAGDKITYTYVVDNAGNRTMTGIALTDARAGAVTCPATSLGVRGSMTCTATAPLTVSQADVDAGTVTGESYLSGQAPGAAAAQRFGPFTVAVGVVAAQPGLGITMVRLPASTAAVTAGDLVQYGYTVTNTGNVTMAALTVRDTRAGTVTCNDAQLAPAAATRCTATSPYLVTLADTKAGRPIVSRAYASGLRPGATGPVSFGPAEDSVAVTAPRPRLTAVQTAAWSDTDGDGLLGTADDIVSTLRVTNTGNVTLVNLRVTGLPAAVTCSPRTAAPGETVTCVSAAYHLTATDLTEGRHTYEAHVTGDVIAAGAGVVRGTAPSTVVVPATDPATDPEPGPVTVPVTGDPIAPTGLAGLALVSIGCALILMSHHVRSATVRPARRRRPRREPVDLTAFADWMLSPQG